MQICEYFFENACYSVTKYYLCKQNNKRSLLGRKQQSQVARSFPNRYLFSLTNKVTYLFPISCILEIIFALHFGANGPKLGANCGFIQWKSIFNHAHATSISLHEQPSRELKI
jgi:conserved domain protein